LLNVGYAAVPLYGILDSTEVESGLSSGPLARTIMVELKSRILISSICCIAIVSSGCYTTFPTTTRTKQSSPTEYHPYSHSSGGVFAVVQGFVQYTSGGGTREAMYTSGFILRDYRWILNPPSKLPSMIYLPYTKSSIDSTIIGKWVQVQGRYFVTQKRQSTTPDYRSQVDLSVDSLTVLD
jgi:hypothetical protein